MKVQITVNIGRLCGVLCKFSVFNNGCTCKLFNRRLKFNYKTKQYIPCLTCRRAIEKQRNANA
jgi:hypothetical protein